MLYKHQRKNLRYIISRHCVRVNINGAMEILTTNVAISSRCSAKTWEIFQKTWEIFQKTWEFFFKTWEVLERTWELYRIDLERHTRSNEHFATTHQNIKVFKSPRARVYQEFYTFYCHICHTDSAKRCHSIYYWVFLRLYCGHFLLFAVTARIKHHFSLLRSCISELFIPMR